ncbi:MAG: transposase [Planctomycetaceae bacterium]|nr:transposase [Planctomycetaceae bacterium]
MLYLPPYSSDLNPMELSFSTLKTLLRREKIRDVGKLQEFLCEPGKFFLQPTSNTMGTVCINN